MEREIGEIISGPFVGTMPSGAGAKTKMLAGSGLKIIP